MAASRSIVAHRLRGFVPSFSDHSTSRQPQFNTLTATADDLQLKLTKGFIKSTQIVEEYQRSIVAHNAALDAVYELCSGAMKRAEEMDRMRAEGTILGPLHGIPVLDNMNLGPAFGLPTTAGALALANAMPSSSATIVEKLLAAGAIIIGKATMSEMAFFKGTGIRCGWSAVAGHAQSAYVRGGLDMEDSIVGHSSPSGSSSGSAIAVSAGLVTLALGSETFGSLVNPAQRAALFTIKPTLGTIPGYGIVPISKSYDTAGPLAKSPKDLADLFTILVDKSKTEVPNGGYASCLTGSWADIKVGTLDPEFLHMSGHVIKPVEEATKQIDRETRAAYEKIRSLAKTYHEDISQMLSDHEFQLNGKDALTEILAFDMEADLNSYLKDLAFSQVRSLKELVDWNCEHSDKALTQEYPNQDLLVLALNADHDKERRQILQTHIESAADKFLDLFIKYDVDVIMAPSDSGLYNFSAAGGFPIATLPISCIDFNGRPFGLTIAAPPHKEAMLFKAMHAWETTFPSRQPPKAYVSLRPID
ncbi:hypothetical protein BGAL_0087g00130 [Botrytis galanthina]|uniref:Amidase domain-containing protein n=1 Tax=Botrytis galanthina TaxID=278940 RepID=A0A4S8R2V1_9HELO|nr:hypothetical protein BGAL_0087g00130 [Botrytis galanthina]